MKKLVFVIFLSILSIAFSQGKGHEKKNKMMKKESKENVNKEMKMGDKSFFKRTNRIIMEARKAVKENKNYSGHLSKAIAHQKYALKLLKKDKNMALALQHSALARSYAKKALEANKSVLIKDLETNPAEQKELGTITSSEVLDKSLLTAEPKAFSATDEASVAMANLEKELDD